MSTMARRTSRNLSGLRRRFAENLVLARNRSDLSQVTVAERSGLHVTQVSLLERGLRLPRLDTIAKLAGALGVEPCELLAGMSWRPPSSPQPGRYARQGSEGSEDR